MKSFIALSVCFASAVFASPVADVAVEQRGTPTAAHPASVARQAAVALCSQYAYHASNGYEILNNLWGKDTATSGSQCTYFEGDVGDGVKFSSTWTWRGGENNVKSYIYAGKILTKGQTIAQLKTMKTAVNWSYNTTNGVRANVAYDVFTAADPNHVNSSGDYELMIWLGRMGNVYPIGSVTATVQIAGLSWDLWTGYNEAVTPRMRVFSFVRPQNDVFNFTADVKEFYNYLTKNQGFPETTQNVIVFQIGTEPFTGGPAKFQVNSFSANLSL